MKKILQTTGEYWTLMLKVFQKPVKWRIFFRQCAVEGQKLTLDSVPLISIISIFIGAVAVIQTINNLESVVTKNNTQTMKVTYTLTEA